VGEGVDVGLLHHVFGFLLVAHDGAGGPVHAFVVAAHQQLEHRRVALQDLTDDVCVALRLLQALRGSGRVRRRHRFLAPSIESGQAPKGDRPPAVTFPVPTPPTGQEALHMDTRLNMPWAALRAGIGLTAALAGIDKFFNLLTDWGAYLSPAVAHVLAVSPATFMSVVGVVEVAVGVAILTGWTRVGAYVASAWLLGVAANLVLAGAYDVAVRDVVMAVAAFTLARLSEVRQHAPAPGFASIGDRAGVHVTG
jgi:hypothetical protein